MAREAVAAWRALSALSKFADAGGVSIEGLESSRLTWAVWDAVLFR